MGLKKKITAEKIAKYTDFLKEIMATIRKNNGGLSSKENLEACKKYKMSWDTISSIIDSGLLKRVGTGKYTIIVNEVQPIHIRRLLELIQDKKAIVNARNRAKIKELTETVEGFNSLDIIEPIYDRKTPSKDVSACKPNKQKLNTKVIKEVKSKSPQDGSKVSILYGLIRWETGIKGSVLFGLIKWNIKQK